MKHNYRSTIGTEEFDDTVKDLLLKHCEGINLTAVKAAAEVSDQYATDDNVNILKEEEVIQKLREKTGTTGIGLAGTQIVSLLIMALNMF